MNRSDITIRRLTGNEVEQALDRLAALRMTVFAAFPYLYDGSEAYERAYLAEFASEPGSVLIAAEHDGRFVGAATASPMAGQKSDFRAPFEERGIDTAALSYFGESVLLPEYRGLGIGHAFFDGRETAAREAGATHACFCAVVRGADHPGRPPDYRPLDAFWKKRGYAPVDGLVTRFDWKEHGTGGDIPHNMQFWMRAL
jgi:GNAT superfamily N-acetyltransferase